MAISDCFPQFDQSGSTRHEHQTHTHPQAGRRNNGVLAAVPDWGLDMDWHVLATGVLVGVGCPASPPPLPRNQSSRTLPRYIYPLRLAAQHQSWFPLEPPATRLRRQWQIAISARVWSCRSRPRVLSAATSSRVGTIRHRAIALSSSRVELGGSTNGHA